MVEVTIRRRDGREISGLECSGHADFGEDGPDLVCAAVSALTGALGIGCSQVLTLPVELGAASGEFQLNVPGEARSHPEYASLQVLLETVVRALNELQQHYAGYIRLSAEGEAS